MKAQGGQTYISCEDRLYKALVHIDGGAIQEVYRTLFFKSIAFTLHFVKSKYRCGNIGTNGDYLTSDAEYKGKYSIQAKGTDKSNAELNFFSNIGFIQYFGKSKCRYDV